MAFNDGERLVVNVDAVQANRELRGVSSSFERMEQAAVKSGNGLSRSLDMELRALSQFREGTAKAFAIAGVLTYADRVGQALARTIVSVINYQDTLSSLKRTIDDVFSPLDAARTGEADRLRLEGVTKQAERILASQERVRSLQGQTRLSGLTGEARVGQEFEIARAALVAKPEFIGLPAGQQQAELLAQTKSFSAQVVAIRKDENEKILAAAKKNEDGLRQQALQRVKFEEDLAVRGTDILSSAMEQRSAEATRFLNLDLQREEKRIDAAGAIAAQIRQIEEDTQLARLSGVERTLKQIEFAEAHRVDELRRLERGGLVGSAQVQAAIAATRENAAAQSGIVIRDENVRLAQEAAAAQERSFESLKRSALGVLTALQDKSTSVWQSIANTFKATMLTAINEVASSWIANILLPVFGGGVTGSRAAGVGTTGPLGGLAGILGRSGGIAPRIPNVGPGGTPPFLPSTANPLKPAKLDLPGHLGDLALVNGRIPTLTAPSKLEEANHLGDLALVNRAAPVFVINQLRQEPSVRRELGNIAAALGPAIAGLGKSGSAGIPAGAVSSTINFGQGALSTGPSAVFPGSPATPPFLPSPNTASTGLTSLSGLKNLLPGLKDFLGIGGSIQTGAGTATTFGAASLGQKLGALGKSDAALLGGLTLALDGIRRGGALGLAETTGGGALVGFKFGGPVGAAIGAGIGAAIGLVGLFRKSPEDKIREAVKKLYRIDIQDKGVLTQIYQTAKNFGSISVGIQSPQVREIVELYALTTAQSGIFGSGRSVTGLVQRGTGLFQETVASLGGGNQALTRIREAPRAPSQTRMIFQIDGEATTKLLRGQAIEAVAENPRPVQAATLKSFRQSSGRRETAAALLAPSILV